LWDAVARRQNFARGGIQWYASCEIRGLHRNALKEEGRMLKEFKEFAMKGNVMDMAVGIIIGAAFGKIVSSFVSDVLMPPLGLVLGKVDFTSLFVDLTGKGYATLADAKKAGAATLNYGNFVQTIVDFLIVAFAIFIVVKNVNRWTTKPAAPAAPTTRDCPQCAMAIPLAAKRCGHCTAQLA
jgi:large conductance mechanosensitive channel